MWTLAMFQMSIVPRESVEKYGSKFAVHPVGTGPFIVREGDWVRGQKMTMNRNPNYHEQYFPQPETPEDAALVRPEDIGRRLPLVDRVVTTFYNESQPMWLEFRSGRLGFATVPGQYYQEAFNARTKKLRPDLADEGITYQPINLLDFIFYGFNMEDEVLGGYSEKQKKLRKAISLAIDWPERNYKFYNEICTIYDGMIPPGLAGHPEGHNVENSYRGPDVQRAKKLLAEAGYPGGKGLDPIDYYTARGGDSLELVEMTVKHLSRIGIRLNPRLDDFSAFIEEVNKKKAPMFSFAWGSDYPDAENNLALFYGPNESPGANHFNYKNADYDALYEKIRKMQPGPERTKIYEQMRDIVLEDCPYLGSMARIRQYLINPKLKNMKATEDFSNWYKYLNVE